MARPRSDDKQKAILSAAIRVIAANGIGAATATIAKEADVSNGALFIYFETKAALLNRLFLELKAEMSAAALGGLPTDDEIREQVFYMWSHWLRWATTSPEKRRTLAYLTISDDITPESRQIASDSMASMTALLERSREHGPMRDVPLEFVVSLVNGLADTTIDFIIADPTNADAHTKAGFEALWRMIV